MIRPTGSIGPIATLLRGGEYTLLYSDALLDELLAKLILPRIREKYDLDIKAINEFVAELAVRGELVTPERRIQVCRDPKDDMFIEVALAGNADYIVTGDEDLLVIKEFEGVRIVTPRVFLAALN